MADWAAMVEARDAEIEQLRGLLRVEKERADSAIDREETAEFAVEAVNTELLRVVEHTDSEIDRLRTQVADFRGWRVALYEVMRATARSSRKTARSANRYRLAWLSARRRAADEANFGMEALDQARQEITRLRAELSRQTTDAPGFKKS
ncbi:hypothetical protein ABTY96_03260 [Streptomyces sp. NPDC096057]|uniref:hypothetical protein n=1 Tax=Streptomyces sp. NPDC096057 TaxID=3155543 RepID=UPI0033255A2E